MTTLLQWLWQGSAIVVALWFVLRQTPRVNASTRYQLWWIALITVLLMPWGGHLATWLRPSVTSLQPGAPTVEALIEVPALPDWLMACVIGAWLGTVLLGLTRLARSVTMMRRIKTRSRPLAPSVERLLTRHGTWRHTGRRRAVLRVSSSVSGACALGLVGEPVIVLSDRLVATLDPDDLDLIVLHEQMHLSRYDDWATLLQSAIDVFFGWHPGVRLIGAALNAEREAACDERVAARIGDARRYARCLAGAADVIAAGRRASVPALVPRIAGTGSLLARVERLLDPRLRRRAAFQPLALGLGVVGLAVASVIAAAVVPIVGANTRDDEVELTAGREPATTSSSIGVEAAVDNEPSVAAAPAFARLVVRTRRDARSRPPASSWVASERRDTPASRAARVRDVESWTSAAEPLGGNSTISEQIPTIPSRVLTGTFVAPAGSTLGEGAGTAPNAGSGSAPAGWTMIGRQVARGSTAFGSQVARGGTALGGFFSRAGKAVAGQF